MLPLCFPEPFEWKVVYLTLSHWLAKLWGFISHDKICLKFLIYHFQAGRAPIASESAKSIVESWVQDDWWFPAVWRVYTGDGIPLFRKSGQTTPFVMSASGLVSGLCNSGGDGHANSSFVRTGRLWITFVLLFIWEDGATCKWCKLFGGASLLHVVLLITQ